MNLISLIRSVIIPPLCCRLMPVRCTLITLIARLACFIALSSVRLIFQQILYHLIRFNVVIFHKCITHIYQSYNKYNDVTCCPIWCSNYCSAYFNLTLYYKMNSTIIQKKRGRPLKFTNAAGYLEFFAIFRLYISNPPTISNIVENCYLEVHDYWAGNI